METYALTSGGLRAADMKIVFLGDSDRHEARTMPVLAERSAVLAFQGFKYARNW